MSSISFQIQGLESLRDTLSKTALDRKLVTGIGLISLQLHNSLKSAIVRTYAIDKSLDSVRLNKTSSSIKRGVNFINSGLEYKDINLRLAEFPTRTFLGNINPGARVKGEVAVVTVKRGRPKIVYGKTGRGGFLRKASKTRVNFTNIFERQTDKRYPIKPLYTIGLAKMAAIVYENDLEVQKVKDNVTNELAKLI